MTRTVLLVLFFWVLMVMEPDWYLTQRTGAPFHRIPNLVAATVLLVTLLRRNKRSVYWPLIIIVLLHLGASIYAENAGLARDPFKFLTYMLILFSASAAFVNTTAIYTLVLKIYLVGFAWYGVQGIPGGLVSWHPHLANEDAYGPLMGMAVGFGYYIGQAFRSVGWKMLAYATCGIGLTGVVASNARGAVVSAALVLGMIWIRSPRKLATLGAGTIGVVVLLAAVQLVLPPGAFWDEMSTISDSAEGGTGQSRLEMWKLSWPVFLENPIIGVGAGNFGVVASEVISHDDGRAQHQDPLLLYMMELHSVYVQIFCEMGIVGMVCFIWMLVVFLQQIRFIRKQAVVRAWRASDPDAPDIRMVSLALEVTMIAFLANAFFYNQTYIHWFWTLIILAYTAHDTSRRTVSIRRTRPGIAEKAVELPQQSGGLGLSLLN